MPLASPNIPVHISTTFHTPEELLKREDLVVPQLYDWHAKEHPDYPVFVYHDGKQLQYLTYAMVNRAIDRVARYIASKVGSGCKEAGATLPVVALFANADSVSYFCTAIGVLRAGCTLFLVSTRNAAVAVADMLSRTGTKHIIVSPDEVMQETAKESLHMVEDSGVRVEMHAMPLFEDLFTDKMEPGSLFEAEVDLPTKFDVSAVAIILHSSGSTGHPKPLGWSHDRSLRLGEIILRGGAQLQGSVMGCHGTPLFHGLGMFMYAAAPILGFVMAVFKPTSPPIVPTPDAFWKGITDTESDFSWSVPSFIEQWARDPDKVLYMQKMRGLIFGGAGLPEEVGDTLASKSISLQQAYGCTEGGMVNDIFKPDPRMDWAYLQIAKGIECTFLPTDEPGMYELVILSPPNMPLPKCNTKIGDRDAYATSDLALPHPTKPGLWKIVGRADDQIILVNGEKTNPIPLERVINEDPRVKSCVIFGRGKFQNGVLIEPTEDYAFAPGDTQKLEYFRNMIWPTIERVNEYAPQHSRLFKEMIIVTSPSKPFEFTIKGHPRRNWIVAQYHDEIEALYKEVEESARSDFPHPDVWDFDSTLSFVRTVVESTLHRSISDDADIFRNGGDSLQATWIRNTIIRAVRETDKDAAKRIPINLVFSAPTVSSLARVVSGLLGDAEYATAHTPADLWKYVEKYSANLPARPASLVERPQGQDVVLITGTTGGFGCDTLEHLLRDESVQTVYAFNRKGAEAMERQRAQFRARGLDETLLDSPKFKMVGVVLHEPGFGLEADLLSEITRSVTHIMHNAWKVDFNLSIRSFEVDIQGVRNLIDLALTSPYTKPPTMIFVSSIGVLGKYSLSTPVPEVPIDDPAVPFGSGYAESKWVTERVLQNVRHQTDLHTIVMRLGQVAGDRLGYWNEKEWFPSLIKSALFQRCLPDLEGTLSWFPAYEAAKAFAEMRRSPEPFLHLVHPHRASWHTLIATIAEILEVPLVSYEQWLSALEQGAETGSASEVEAMKQNPALRLLPFFKAQAQYMAPDREPMGLVYLSTEKAQQVSESLILMPVLDAKRARMWVGAWKKAGFL